MVSGYHWRVVWICAAISLWVWWPVGGAALAQDPVSPREPPVSRVLRLSLEDALALFLRQNLDLIIENYGIDASKGRQITARLFPNPTLSANTFSAYTQECNLTKCGAVMPTVSQLFEVAGRRGFRIEAAGFGTLSVEAKFEDAVRQLSFALKDTYFRVQRQRGHLRVDREIRDLLVQLLRDRPTDPNKTARGDAIRLGLMTVNAEAEVIMDRQIIEERSGELRVLLGIAADVELELTTELGSRKVPPNLSQLLDYALENRPDIRAKRLIKDQRKSELKLAQAIRYPNVTAEVGYMMQGPKGPDNQQQWTMNLSVPLPIFDRNQGGIVEAESYARAADADIQKTRIAIQNEVTVAYRKFLLAQELIEATQGALTRASELFQFQQEQYLKGLLPIVDLENVRRAYGDARENHVEAVFDYQQAWLMLERAAGRDITS
jgi:cobalt-zinc-cadmium efflux system outer membrane protein